MYKWVKELDGCLVCYHMENDNPSAWYSLMCHEIDSSGCCQDIEIIQSPRTVAAENELRRSCSERLILRCISTI